MQCTQDKKRGPVLKNTYVLLVEIAIQWNDFDVKRTVGPVTEAVNVVTTLVNSRGGLVSLDSNWSLLLIFPNTQAGILQKKFLLAPPGPHGLTIIALFVYPSATSVKKYFNIY